MLTEVKNLKTVCKEMVYSDSNNFDNADSTDCVDKVTTFWVNKNQPWCRLRTILRKCNELEAASHVEWLETHNQEGNFIFILHIIFRSMQCNNIIQRAK